MNQTKTNRCSLKTSRKLGAAALCLVALTGCANTGLTEVSVPLDVAGSASSTFEREDGWRLELSRADVAFGPLYLCSGVTAGHLCETARAEWTGSVVVDALNPAPKLAGTIEGSSGMTRSWMYDHGITSLLSTQGSERLEAAKALGGDSVIIEGVAEQGDEAVVFSARLPLQQEAETEVGVPLVRKSNSEPFSQDLDGQGQRLLVRFDPASWLRDVDFAAIAAESSEMNPMAETGGASEPVTFEPSDQAFRAIQNAIIAGQRPSFEWQEQ